VTASITRVRVVSATLFGFSSLDLFGDPRAIGYTSDSGAHGQVLCGIGAHADMLVSFVRDSQDLTIEEGVYNFTGKFAGHFGMQERGEIKIGKSADIVVFDLNAIERRPVEKVYDVPDGEGGRTWPYSRAPAPMKLTLVNGVPTFDRNASTANFPGQVPCPGWRKPSLAHDAE
jgi:N-acyl-D-aspartate/D-glutamate deacylase